MNRTLIVIATLLSLGVVVAILFLILRPKETTPTTSLNLLHEEFSVKVDTLLYDTPQPATITPIAESRDTLYTFRDTLNDRWSAEVSGSNVELRSLILLDRVEQQRSYVAPNWEVGLKSGIASGSMWAGVGVSRRWGRVTVSLDGGYDTWRETPYVGASLSYTLWRE